MDKRTTGTGLGILVIGGLIDVVNYYPTTRVIVDGLKRGGGTGAIVANVLLDPVFGLVVIVVGLVLIYRGRKRDGGSMTDHDKGTPPMDNDAAASDRSAAASGQVATAITNNPVNKGGDSESKSSAQAGVVFMPTFNIGSPPQPGPTAGHSSTAAYLGAQPKKKREEALSALLPDISVEYVDSADVSCFLVNKGGAATVAVKARVAQPHPLFRIATWYFVRETVVLKARIGEETVQLVHLSSDGKSIYLNGTSANSWHFAEAQDVPRPFKPLILEVRYIVEPHTIERPIDVIQIDFEHPRAHDRLGRFTVKRV